MKTIVVRFTEQREVFRQVIPKEELMKGTVVKLDGYLRSVELSGGKGIEYPFQKMADLDPYGIGTRLDEKFREAMSRLLEGVARAWASHPVAQIQIDVTMKQDGLLFWLEAEVRERADEPD